MLVTAPLPAAPSVLIEPAAGIEPVKPTGFTASELLGDELLEALLVESEVESLPLGLACPLLPPVAWLLVPEPNGDGAAGVPAFESVEEQLESRASAALTIKAYRVLTETSFCPPKGN